MIKDVPSLTCLRSNFALLCFASCVAALACRPAVVRAQFDAESGIATATIDAQTRWAFRALSPVTVSSPIIRLGDVVKPLDPNMAGWQRLRRSPIGLVPLGGQSMTIQRDRLAKAIYDAEATPLAIDWIGPTKIQVVYREADLHEPAADFATASYRGDDGPSAVGTAGYEIESPTSRQGDSMEGDSRQHVSGREIVPLSMSEFERIVHWIEIALERQHPSILETYEIEFDRRHAPLASLRSVAGVTSIDPQDRVGEGSCGFHIVGRSIDGPVEVDVDLQLKPHPIVVVARTNLPRGHRLQAHDLTSQPVPADEFAADFVLDPDDVIGLEVRGSVRANRPLLRSDLGMPTLIHRGDLIEVRVVGGGITVTTNAKSLSDGSASDLIEVETLQPRKRLVARVVQPGTCRDCHASAEGPAMSATQRITIALAVGFCVMSTVAAQNSSLLHGPQSGVPAPTRDGRYYSPVSTSTGPLMQVPGSAQRVGVAPNRVGPQNVEALRQPPGQVAQAGYDGRPRVLLNDASWTFQPAPPLRQFQKNDVVTIRVDEITRVMAEGGRGEPQTHTVGSDPHRLDPAYR